MALPTFVGNGNPQASTAGFNCPWPAGHQADDIGLLVVETANEAVTAPSGWADVLNSPQGTGTAAAAGSTRLHIFWKRATSNAEPTVPVPDSGDHQIARLFVFRGCINSGNPWDVTAGAVQASASTSVSMPSVTTTVANCLIVLVSSNATDTTVGQQSGAANAGLANLTSLYTHQSGVGVGGGYQILTGEKATAGATGATTATLATASTQALLTIALKPPTAGTDPFGGFYVATGVMATSGATGASTGTLQSAQVQAAITIALKPPVVVTNTAPVLTAIPDLIVTVGDTLDYFAAATDAEGGPLLWELFPGTTVLPGSLAIDSVSGEITWTPAFFHQGVWNIKVRVTDPGGLFAEQNVNITVSGGPANALDIANRATTDFQSAKTLVELVLQADQINAQVITRAQALRDDLGISKAFMDNAIADLNAQNP
jgi:Putative Ig domain.